MAVASADVPPRTSYSVRDEENLVLAGFLSFADEPLADAAEALASLRRDGVEMKIISGDNDRVTGHVCAEVGVDPGRIVTGDDLERLTDPALQHASESTREARVSPAQKIQSFLL